MTDAPRQKFVVIVGATKGLGLALAEEYLDRGWRVVATSLEPSAGLDELAKRYGPRLQVVEFDITSRADALRLQEALAAQRIDVLHIVAGVFQRTTAPVWEQPAEEILRLLETNAIGAVRLAELLAPQVQPGGVFAFTSSGMGSLWRNDRGDVDLYRVSKATLNMLVRSFAARHRDSGRATLLLCPGWAKTDMGGPDATVEVSDSVRGMYRLVASARPDPTGAVFREYTGNEIPW